MCINISYRNWLKILYASHDIMKPYFSIASWVIILCSLVCAVSLQEILHMRNC